MTTPTRLVPAMGVMGWGAESLAKCEHGADDHQERAEPDQPRQPAEQPSRLYREHVLEIHRAAAGVNSFASEGP